MRKLTGFEIAEIARDCDTDVETVRRIEAKQHVQERADASDRLVSEAAFRARKQIQFDGVQTESTAIAAIRASKSGLSELNGENIPVLQGQGSNGQPITLFPGEVPQTCPPSHFWQQQGFEFPDFLPPQLGTSHSLPHIRMDQILDFLLADKLA